MLIQNLARHGRDLLEHRRVPPRPRLHDGALVQRDQRLGRGLRVQRRREVAGVAAALQALRHAGGPRVEEAADALAELLVHVAHLQGDVADEAARLAAVAVIKGSGVQEHPLDRHLGLRLGAERGDAPGLELLDLEVQHRQRQLRLAAVMMEQVGAAHPARRGDLRERRGVVALEVDDMLRLLEYALADRQVGFASHIL
jgi:hypothetical protein